MISRRYNTESPPSLTPHVVLAPAVAALPTVGSLELNQPGAVWSSKLEEKGQNDFDLLQTNKMAFQQTTSS